MAYAAMDIARYVINYCIDLGKPISNLKLQKILYYIQAAFLVEKGEPCFEDRISRWRHGPVVTDVYNEFKKFIGDNIYEKQEEYIEYELDDELNFKIVTKKFEPRIINKEDRDLIDKVIKSLINIGAWELVKRTHEEEPWIQTSPNEEITLESIRNFFMKNDINEGRIYGRN